MRVLPQILRVVFAVAHVISGVSLRDVIDTRLESARGCLMEAVSSLLIVAVKICYASRQPRISSENTAVFCLDPQILDRCGY